MNQLAEIVQQKVFPSLPGFSPLTHILLLFWLPVVRVCGLRSSLSVFATEEATHSLLMRQIALAESPCVASVIREQNILPLLLAHDLDYLHSPTCEALYKDLSPSVQILVLKGYSMQQVSEKDPALEDVLERLCEYHVQDSPNPDIVDSLVRIASQMSSSTSTLPVAFLRILSKQEQIEDSSQQELTRELPEGLSSSKAFSFKHPFAEKTCDVDFVFAGAEQLNLNFHSEKSLLINPSLQTRVWYTDRNDSVVNLLYQRDGRCSSSSKVTYKNTTINADNIPIRGHVLALHKEKYGLVLTVTPTYGSTNRYIEIAHTEFISVAIAFSVLDEVWAICRFFVEVPATAPHSPFSKDSSVIPPVQRQTDSINSAAVDSRPYCRSQSHLY